MPSEYDRYLAEQTASVELALVSALREYGGDAVPRRLAEALRYAVLGGGKRVRPNICLAACTAAGGRRTDAMPAALAIELLHAYTLVHDDLPCMDDDDERRGQPTVHVKFGEAEAVLVGDALQAMAFEQLSGLRIEPERYSAALKAFCRAAGPGGVIGGQWVDVTAVPPHDLDRVRYVHRHKTADIIECAAKIGAIAGGATGTQIEKLAKYGHYIGLAFQIVDDLLDAPQSRGEPGELNCLYVWSVEKARETAGDYTGKALAALDDLPGDTDPLRECALRLINRKF